MKAGVQCVNITPPIGTPLGGYITRGNVSQGVHDNLWAETIVIENEGSLVAVVVADLLGFDGKLVKKIRHSISRTINLSPNNVMVVATHTHSGPDLLLGYQGKASAAYVQVLTESIIGAVSAAWRARFLIVLGVGRGVVEGVGATRRGADGLPVDPHIGVLRFDHEGGNSRGLL